MLQDLTPDSFETHQGTSFRIGLGGETALELVLQQVRRLEPHPGPRAVPFSAYFLGPRSPRLSQRIYTVAHDQMGTFDLFLVPLGPDPKAGGMLYEAVFN
ncbi:MAG TPA: hypothetical protein VIE43_09155 [Thermoanaerobaculia bacterium]|jgi:hypothetical protein|nr:hypothetical protein [Thermoanaerobaculia bacterium]